MGYFVGLPLGGGMKKIFAARFGKNMTFQVETRAPHLPAEWTLQSGIQLTWPHANTDWAYMLEEVQQCFIAIASEIAKVGVANQTRNRGSKSKFCDGQHDTFSFLEVRE